MAVIAHKSSGRPRNGHNEEFLFSQFERIVASGRISKLISNGFIS